jgi:hypothetical protein
VSFHLLKTYIINLYSLGLVCEIEKSSGWKRIEGDFGKFSLIMEIPPPQYLLFPFIALVPEQALISFFTLPPIGKR